MSSEPAPPTRRKRGRGRLAAAFVVILSAIAILLFLLLQGVPSIYTTTTTSGGNSATTGAGAPLHVLVYPTEAGFKGALSDVSSTPVAVSFTAEPPGTGIFSYLWAFGDGGSSTSQAVTHVFQTNCVYVVTLNVTNSVGPDSSAALFFFFSTYKHASGTMIVCPQQGTAGITKVELGGAYYGSTVRLGTQVDNAGLANVTTDLHGSWAINITGDLEPEVDGSLYNFTTQPYSVRSSFLTLEGIKATPASGEPGDGFTLEGRSYPAYTTVTIYLGGIKLGQAQSDGNGAFLANMTVPFSFHYAGTYQFATSPPVLGASATFTIPVSSTTPSPPPNLFWPWILAVPAAAVVLLGVLLWRRRTPVDLEVFQEQVTTPFSSVWAIRVWGNGRLAKCAVTYDRTPLQTIVSPTEAKLEAMLPKGESVDFRVPSSLAIVEDAWVVVKDGDKTVRSVRFGSIPHARS